MQAVGTKRRAGWHFGLLGVGSTTQYTRFYYFSDPNSPFRLVTIRLGIRVWILPPIILVRKEIDEFVMYSSNIHLYLPYHIHVYIVYQSVISNGCNKQEMSRFYPGGCETLSFQVINTCIWPNKAINSFLIEALWYLRFKYEQIIIHRSVTQRDRKLQCISLRQSDS